MALEDINYLKVLGRQHQIKNAAKTARAAQVASVQSGEFTKSLDAIASNKLSSPSTQFKGITGRSAITKGINQSMSISNPPTTHTISPLNLTNFKTTKFGKFATNPTTMKYANYANIGLNIADGLLTDRTNITDKKTQNISKAINIGGSIASNFSSAASNPVGGTMIAAGKLVGGLIGGRKNRLYGYGSTAVDAISTGLSFIPGGGWIAAAALQFVNGLGLGQKRAITVKNFANEYADPYTGSAEKVSRTIAKYSGKKGGTFDFGSRKRANKRLRNVSNIQNRALLNVYDAQNMNNSMNSEIMEGKNIYKYSGSIPQLTLSARRGMKIPELEDARKILSLQSLNSTNTTNLQKFQTGGKLNTIVSGTLHARRNNLEEVDPELEGQITKKGIPVISKNENGEIQQHAEIEVGELVLNLESTKTIESLYKQYEKATEKDKKTIAIECGKLVADEILHNTDDRIKLIKSIK